MALVDTIRLCRWWSQCLLRNERCELHLQITGETQKVAIDRPSVGDRCR